MISKVMKKIIFFSILLFPILLSAQGQENEKRVWNPFTRRFELFSKVYPVNDSVINFGVNNSVSSDTLNGAIGFWNYVNTPNSMVLGYHNYTIAPDNILIGAYLDGDSSQTITIGRGLSTAFRMVNSKYQSIGLGMFATEPVMYIQSGYEPGESYVADIGGVSIGGPELDTLTALQINKHLTSGYFVKCKNTNQTTLFSVDYDGNAEVSGNLVADSVICNYVPTINQAAADTTGITPVKIGDQFIDTSAGDVYISVGTSRGDWIKL